MEYCCHVWAGAEKWICRTVGLFFAACLDSLAHHWTGTSLSYFCRCYIGRCISELAQLFPLPYSWGRFSHYSDRSHDFAVTIPRCFKDVYVNSFFLHTARPWNSLSMVCFPLKYDLNGIKSRINRLKDIF